ncbi:hypothetical protein A3A63_03675 [Candidatus Gottesmanbacteria bacterium RIFCSPLOWO2_01_FULL_46_9]|uniref:Addiction module toxin RelE n=1 Tax=Candidatus Gottesmanbacteria bacterium RIFCSPLOWO2_01_FULL_46_9 TaxID=1798394 RepID=A0A1F6AY69_9BACT|nr:MAG: hypothetical protein A3A63_03675 [Candidatus Gottesmanbacteria bacterium RIFCSPLOWO2_01_FULL_46_9]
MYYVAASGHIPVADFLNAAGPKIKSKALRILMHVEEYGLHAVISHIKKLSGTPIWEIRILGTDSVRILFITEIDKHVLLLHAFYKKTQKTPAKDIAVALNRLDEYRGRT